MAAHYFDEDMVATPAAGASEQSIGIAFILLSIVMVIGQLVFLQRFVNRIKTFPPTN